MTPAFHDNEGPPLVGYYTYSVVDDHWSWSEGMYTLLGFEAGEITPSTGLLVEHQHPDDRAGVYEALDTAVRVATPFSCYHRVIDRHGREHSVLLVGRGVRDDRGVVEELVGFFVDIASSASMQRERRAPSARDDSTDSGPRGRRHASPDVPARSGAPDLRLARD